jgi:hypothetical protein
MAAVVSALICAPIVQAQNQQQPVSAYAFENCKSGCVFNGTSDSVIYTGANSKSYRICSADRFEVKVQVDGQFVLTRECVDVNGKSLFLMSGKSLVGRLPD